MKPFLNDEFLLESSVATELFTQHARHMPIIDFHCHLDPQKIAGNYRFKNLTEIWLGGDHYKWRAMRAHGVDERYITGDSPDREKFLKWAEVVPYTMCNPLYHWTHLELQRFFGITTLLNPSTAAAIYDECTEKLQTEPFRARELMLSMAVEAVGTTDDPADNLAAHLALKQEGFGIAVLPTWRPDKAMAVDNPKAYGLYLGRLEAASGMQIARFDHLLEALRKRQDFFVEAGCRMSDHGIDMFYAMPFTEADMNRIFDMARAGKEVSAQDHALFCSGMLHLLAEMNFEKGWTQQFHVGAIRNNNLRQFAKLGPDTGYDSMHDSQLAAAGNRFLGRLDAAGKLAPTILYNLNPSDFEVLATMAGNFNEGPQAGKMQLGSGWWFLDQKSGMERQLDALSKLGLLSHFVGMLTDSRSFLSYPRHEYFRRILCNLIGNQVENGELPASELPFIGKMVENICYYNAKKMVNG